MITTGSCCGCIKLRTGTIIIGVLTLVGSIVIVSDIFRLFGTGKVTGLDWFNLFISVLQGLLAALLLTGVFKQIQEFIFYYLWGDSVCVILRLVYNIWLVLLASTGLAGLTLGLLIVFALSLYLLIVVYSYYKEMSPGLPQ